LKNWDSLPAASMKNLFDTATREDIKQRLGRLRPESQRQWGKMTPAQTMAHCSAAIELAMGGKPMPPRLWIGRLFGPIAKRSLLVKGEPMRRDAQTAASVLISEERDFSSEQQRLSGMIETFATAGPDGCTKEPHFFFGRLTPVEWAALMYQHLDHHFRQFQV